jgi:hypothetical protein
MGVRPSPGRRRGKDDEGEDADVGVLDVSAHLHGQQEEPAEEGGEREAHPQQAEPMARHQDDEGRVCMAGASEGGGPGSAMVVFCSDEDVIYWQIVGEGL